MTNEKAQALIDNLLETRSWFSESFPNEDDLRRIEAIDQSIKAIELLIVLATDEAHFNGGGWCSEQARNYLENL